jgi:hypothetical protein
LPSLRVSVNRLTKFLKLCQREQSPLSQDLFENIEAVLLPRVQVSLINILML